MVEGGESMGVQCVWRGEVGGAGSEVGLMLLLSCCCFRANSFLLVAASLSWSCFSAWETRKESICLSI